MGDKKLFCNVSGDKTTALTGKGSAPGNHEQNEGHSTGDGTGKAHGKAAHHPHMEKADVFTVAPARNSHGYGSVRVGQLRHSGHPGAHRIGKR